MRLQSKSQKYFCSNKLTAKYLRKSRKTKKKSETILKNKVDDLP